MRLVKYTPNITLLEQYGDVFYKIARTIRDQESTVSWSGERNHWMCSPEIVGRYKAALVQLIRLNEISMEICFEIGILTIAKEKGWKVKEAQRMPMSAAVETL